MKSALSIKVRWSFPVILAIQRIGGELQTACRGVSTVQYSFKMNFSVDYIINHLTPKRTQVLQDLQLDELPVENIQAVHTDVNSRAFLDLRPSQNQQNQVND